MNIEQSELDDWVSTCQALGGLVNGLEGQIRAGARPAAEQSLTAMRDKLATIERRVIRAGGRSSLVVPDIAVQPEIPLELLDTPANRHFARLLREAMQACQDVERERGIADGASEVLEDWLVQVEEELHGPTGKGEGG
jgi:hypothetical protein